MKLDTTAQVESVERTLRLVWVIVGGAVLYSVLTVTPLVERVTPKGWGLTAPILPIVVDVAVVIVVRVGAIVARLDGHAGFWPALLRWLTGAMTLALNIGNSALTGDWVGVGVHMVAPTLLIVTAEAELKWRRAITAAVARIAAERAAERREREERSRQEAERSRAERERSRQAEEARQAQERQDRLDAEERSARSAREERDHQARIAREEREHQARMAREEADRQAEREEREQARERDRVERERRENEDRRQAEAKRDEDERERQIQQARERREQEREREQAERERREREREQARERLSATAVEPLPEAEARHLVTLGTAEGIPQRQIAAATGWSTGWVAKVAREERTPDTHPTPADLITA